MPSIGKGAREIRVQCKGQYRIVYVTGRVDSILVLHAFSKKSRKTSKRDIDRARRALRLTTKR
jgi:phage-related protein